MGKEETNKTVKKVAGALGSAAFVGVLVAKLGDATKESIVSLSKTDPEKAVLISVALLIVMMSLLILVGVIAIVYKMTFDKQNEIFQHFKDALFNERSTNDQLRKTIERMNEDAKITRRTPLDKDIDDG